MEMSNNIAMLVQDKTHHHLIHSKFQKETSIIAKFRPLSGSCHALSAKEAS